MRRFHFCSFVSIIPQLGERSPACALKENHVYDRTVQLSSLEDDLIIDSKMLACLASKKRGCVKCMWEHAWMCLCDTCICKACLGRQRRGFKKFVLFILLFKAIRIQRSSELATLSFSPQTFQYQPRTKTQGQQRPQSLLVMNSTKKKNSVVLLLDKHSGEFLKKEATRASWTCWPPPEGIYLLVVFSLLTDEPHTPSND